MSKAWFDQHHARFSTPQFEEWWLDEYGPPELYQPTNDEQNEYWIRKGFAMKGWVAGENHGESQAALDG